HAAGALSRGGLAAARISRMQPPAGVSRRDFLRASAVGGVGTALGSLVGLGLSLDVATARAQELRIKDAKATPSVCPYCSVGCATIVHTIDGEIVNIEGDPAARTAKARCAPRAPPSISSTRIPTGPPRYCIANRERGSGTRWTSSGRWTVSPSSS